MQLLLNSCPPGFTEPDLGSLGLSAAKKDPSSEVLPDQAPQKQLCIQLHLLTPPVLLNLDVERPFGKVMKERRWTFS